MKSFKSIFPLLTTTKIPDNISSCLEDYAHRELTDTLHDTKGFVLLTESERFITADNRWLFRYAETKRKANAPAVQRLHQQRLQKATDKGREITRELSEELRQQAIAEVLKTAPITESVVDLIYDENAGRIWCGGGSAGKCQKAIKHLRSALGSLKTTPLLYDLAARHVARQLCQGADYMRGFPANLLIPENARVLASDGDQSVTFDGVDLRDEGVGSVLQGMMVRAVEMVLLRPGSDGKCEHVASFILHIPESGAVYLKSLDYQGEGAGDEGDTAHHFATEMLIISGFAWEIFDTLRAYFHGSSSAPPRTALSG